MDAYAICPEPPPTGVTDKVGVDEGIFVAVTIGVAVWVASTGIFPVGAEVGVRVFVGTVVAVGGTSVAVEVGTSVNVGGEVGVIEAVTVLVGTRNGI